MALSDDDIIGLDLKNRFFGFLNRKPGKKYASAKIDKADLVNKKFSELQAYPWHYMLWLEARHNWAMVIEYDFSKDGVVFKWTFNGPGNKQHIVGPFGVSKNTAYKGNPGLILEKMAQDAVRKLVPLFKDLPTIKLSDIQAVDFENDIVDHMRLKGKPNIVGTAKAPGGMRNVPLFFVGKSLCLALQWVQENTGYVGTAKIRVTNAEGVEAGMSIYNSNMELLKEVDIPITDGEERIMNFGGQLQPKLTAAVVRFVSWAKKQKDKE